ESVELVDHRVDGVFQFENFAAGIDGDFPGEIAAGDGGGDIGDISHLIGEVGGHAVYIGGEILPSSGHAADFGLTAEFSVSSVVAYFDYTAVFYVSSALSRYAGLFGCESVELVDHRVDGVFQLEDFALGIDGDFFGKIAVGDGGGDLGNVADLIGEVGRHAVYI